jgi:hypothetical protein
MQILRVIREYGPISRVDIACRVELTRAAVTIITNEMIDQKVLKVVGEEPVSLEGELRKGRRKILLDINPSYKFVFGIYIDEKELSIGLTTLNHAVLDKTAIPFSKESTAQEAVEHITETIGEMLDVSCLERADILGVGIGVMPSMYDQMEGELDEEHMPHFPVLRRQLIARTGLEVYTNSALLQFATAGVHFRENHAKTENQVFLYWDNPHYRAIPLCDSEPFPDALRAVTFVERICVNPNGKAYPGYPDGSVRGELSQDRMQQRVGKLFKAGKTPTLFAEANGELDQVTFSMILTASRGDSALAPIVKDLLRMFCNLLYTLQLTYFAEYICLYNFGFTKDNMNLIREHATYFAGEQFANSILYSPIREDFHFLCGCSYVIQHGFYLKGGLENIT